MTRHSEIVTSSAASIKTYVDGNGPAVVLIPSYGRDAGDDFVSLTAAASILLLVVSFGRGVHQPLGGRVGVVVTVDHRLGEPVEIRLRAQPGLRQ